MEEEKARVPARPDSVKNQLLDFPGNLFPSLADNPIKIREIPYFFNSKA